MAGGGDGRPRHQQVAAEFRAAIMAGDLAPGAQLPTTQQLMARYETTSQTVQRALGVLKDEGYLVGRVGVGVYVREDAPLAVQPAAYMQPAAPGEPYRWVAEAAGRSRRGRSRLLEVARVVPPAAVAEAFGLPAGGFAVLRHQLLLLDGEPSELVWLYFPDEVAAGTRLAERRLVPGGVPALLAELGHPVRRWVDRLSSRMPTADELEALALPDGVPVLRTFRVAYTGEGRPVEASVLVKGAHRYELVYEQRSP